MQDTKEVHPLPVHLLRCKSTEPNVPSALVCLISASIAKGTVGRLALGQIRPWESKVAVPG